jgi:hypothetical protein
MLSPLFLFFFMFQQTTAMFWSWVKFLLGTLVSLAVITLLGSIMMEMMMNYAGKVVAAFFVNALINQAAAAGVPVSGGFDMSASAMQLGALGALATALLTMVPPLIMGFFNSGAAFAGSALMAMGGAGAGLAGVSQALSGGAGGAGGAAGASGNASGSGAPALGHSGSSGATASDNFAASNNQTLLNRANGSQGGGNAGLPAPGNGNSIGIGAHGNANVAQIRSMQSGSDFRSGSNMHTSGAAANRSSGQSSGPDADGWYSNGTSVSDATIKRYEDQGLSLGSGGSLGVSGGNGSVGGGQALVQAAPREAVSIGNSPAPSPSAVEVASASPYSDTPIQALPRGQMGAANRIT